MRTLDSGWAIDVYSSPMDAQARMQSESRIIEGAPADNISDPLMTRPTFQISRREFLLKLPNGQRFHYRKGEGVWLDRGKETSEQEIKLFFEGSVYGAIAYLNGLIPLHASSVILDGKVRAFTAHSGGGKSTLVAGLLARGFKLFSDDVLLLDLSDPNQIWCLPGHKKLKLWQDAVNLTGAEAGPQVRPELQKYFISAQGATCSTPAPLADLYQLQNAGLKGTAVSEITGAQRFSTVRKALYRRKFAHALLNNLGTFQVASTISKNIRILEFDRKKRCERYWDDLDVLIAGMGSVDG